MLFKWLQRLIVLPKFGEALAQFPTRYAEFVVRWRFALLGITLVLTLIALTQIHRIIIRNDPDSLLPLSNPHVQTNLYVEQTFGMGNLVVIGLEVQAGDIYQPWFINAVRDLHHKLEQLPGAKPENFIAITAKKVRYLWGTEDGLDIRPLVPRAGIAADPQQAAAELNIVRDGLERNVILRPMLLSKDKKATFIVADFDSSIKDHYYTWALALRTVLDQAKDPRFHIYVAGEPYFLAWMLVELMQHWYLFVISIVLVFAVLYAETQQVRSTLLPILAVSISIIWTLGLMGATQFHLTTMMVLTPVLIFAVGIGHAVQIMRRYFDELERVKDYHKAAVTAISGTFLPASMAVITDVVGFFSLALVDISFYQDYAYFGMFGMSSLLFTTITLLPLGFIPWSSTTTYRPSKLAVGVLSTWESRLGHALIALLISPWKWLPVLAAAIIVTLSAALIPRIELGINYPEAAFKKGTPLIDDLYQLNRMMPGVVSFNIPFLGKQAEVFKDVELLKAIAQMEAFLLRDPHIGFTSSFAQYLRLLNKHMHNNDVAYWTLPDDPALVEQYIFTYAMGADSGDFSSVVDYDYTNGQIIGYINSLNPLAVHETISRIRQYIELHRGDAGFSQVAIGLPTLTGEIGVGGFAGTTEATREVNTAQWLSNPLFTALLVGIIIMLMFRSFMMAALIMAMVGITLMAQYGLGGYFSSVGNWGGNLHFGNLVTLSIAMGLGVDYSIYLAARFRAEYAATEDLDATLIRTLSTTGSSVVLSVAILCISLLPLMATDLANTWGLAMYIGVAILTSVFTTLLLLPLLLRGAVNLPFTLIQASNLLNLQVSERTLALRKEKEQLVRALEMLKEAQDRLVQSEKMASLGGLVAGVAHEINTPLGNAVTATSFLYDQMTELGRMLQDNKMKRSDLDAYLKTAAEGFQMLQHNMERAANLVHSFKQVAVDQTSELERSFDLKPYLDEVLLSLSPLIRKNQLTVELNCREQITLTSYPGAFAQIITNLISNAALHAFDGQKSPKIIQIDALREGAQMRSVYPLPQTSSHRELFQPTHEHVVFRIGDNGKGMAPELLKRIYEPFFTTRRGAGGSGLGLHITYNLVTQTLGGEITCYSQVGEGTEFTIKIPIKTQGMQP